MAQLADTSRGLQINVNKPNIKHQVHTGTDSNIQTVKKNKNSIPVTHYHVSCRSDMPKQNENAGGVVLYQKDGKNDWYCNGVHCKSGYIIIKNTSSTNKVKLDNDGSMIHNKVYKAVFGEKPGPSVIRGGFSWYNNEWKYNSLSCNANSKYSDGQKPMNDLEIAEVSRAVKEWMKSGGKCQTFKCKETLYINE